MISKRPHVIIVGAGIVGTSLAYHLSRQNASVTLIDKLRKPGCGLTESSFAWITAGIDEPDAYLNLRQQAILDWRKVNDELKGQLNLDWSGALTWRADTVETERIAHKLIGLGNNVRLVDQKEIRRLEPDLKEVPAEAIFAPTEGAIDPILATEVFVKAAREAGANIQFGNKVLSLMTEGSRIIGVVTTNGNITANIVVLATGTSTAALCQPLDLILPINISPAILISLYNNRRFVNRIVSSPSMEVRAASNTQTLSAEDYIDESLDNNPQAIAQRTLKEIKKNWQGTKQIQLANVMVGKRPIPRDGLPIIGRTTDIEGLYLLIMHSGVTLAAIAGRLATAEILSDQDNNLLSPYRLKRFN